VLAYLLAQRDWVVSKQELLAQLWPEQCVGEEALTSCIKILRRALGERGRTARFLRTLHGQGYREGFDTTDLQEAQALLDELA
jgi:DNA-binding winged helix-turn-helix (wHTH) protein